MSLAIPFVINVPDNDIADLRQRLRATRWSAYTGEGWEAGVDGAWHRELVTFWAEKFDWRKAEGRLNRFPHFRTLIDQVNLHYIHIRGTGVRKTPILLLHGWPGSYVQMLDLAVLLADGEGGFDVVIGSLPGYGYSDDLPRGAATEPVMARLFHRLMTETLGYDRYAIRGSDWGAGVLEHMAHLYPDHVIGTHQGGTSPRATSRPADASDAERAFFANVDLWQATEVGYSRLQASKPETLATALNDSPAGLAGWISEKFRRWSDCDGDVERRFTKDKLLTNISIYWFTGTIGSSIRLYRESVEGPLLTTSTVPSAFLMPINDMFPTPREWIARRSRVDRWNAPKCGGHFMEWEEPEVVATDIREFINSLIL